MAEKYSVSRHVLAASQAWLKQACKRVARLSETRNVVSRQPKPAHWDALSWQAENNACTVGLRTLVRAVMQSSSGLVHARADKQVIDVSTTLADHAEGTHAAVATQLVTAAASLLALPHDAL
jgi:hypothetical protein